MPDTTQKTNAMRMLDGKGIPYVTYCFSPDIHSAEGVADVVEMPVD